MSKLIVLSAQDICKILEEYGFTKTRQCSSHSIMQKQTEDSTITVPVPNFSEVRIGTLQSIIRQSGLPRSLFEIF